ncbi:hypothetical protein P3T36_004008 [Kitasatospora sp. MAP12-15]|nr:hypothetical protein [Kitasatospora sp. MAP12-44]
MAPTRFDDLPAQLRPRLVVQTTLRTTATVALVVAIYYLVPMDRAMNAATVAGLALSVLAIFRPGAPLPGTPRPAVRENGAPAIAAHHRELARPDHHRPAARILALIAAATRADAVVVMRVPVGATIQRGTDVAEIHGGDLAAKEVVGDRLGAGTDLPPGPGLRASTARRPRSARTLLGRQRSRHRRPGTGRMEGLLKRLAATALDAWSVTDGQGDVRVVLRLPTWVGCRHRAWNSFEAASASTTRITPAMTASSPASAAYRDESPAANGVRVIATAATVAPATRSVRSMERSYPASTATPGSADRLVSTRNRSVHPCRPDSSVNAAPRCTGLVGAAFQPRSSP